GLRLMVAGESTAAGFPYGRFGSPAALLQQRLKRQFPDQPIEVISTAMAAINSYTVLDIMPELLAAKPDAILLYLGHNEYVGLLGVGSQFQASPNRQLTLWWLQLKKWRLYQLMQQLVQSVTPTPEATGQTTMAQMAGQSGIPLHSDAYQAGVAQFQQNLAAITALAQQAKVPLILTTVVSNELDIAPFLTESFAEEQLATPAFAARMDGSQPQQVTLQQLPALLKATPDDAMLQYQYGKALLANRQPEAALQALQQAKDLDLLRFRAPAVFNQFLREQSKAPGIWLADAEHWFRQHSSDGILGSELLLEHVHPNQQGYQLLADSWWRSLHRAGLIQGFDPEPSAEPDSLLSVLDLATAQFKISLLLADYPFDQRQQVQPPTVADFTQTFFLQFPAMPVTLQQLASAQIQGGDWLKLHQQLLAYYQQQRDAPNAAKIAALLSDALPFKADIAFAAGQLYFAASDPALARYYQWRAVQLQPEALQFRLMLARSMAAFGDLKAALAQLEVVLQQQPNQPIALQQHARIKAALATNQSGVTP
ncbi:MAG: hypothetical protein KKF79_18990, partial [Gammaproteobacteria bacterium]|nr:hypothetical protein [Gammaproteobacteria bacterium]